MHVGFAGLGRMGRPMARRLAQAGHHVLAYDPAIRAATAPAELRDAGVEVTDDVARFAQTEMSVSMLPDAAATESLMLDEPGLLAHCVSSHVHLVMGTVGPAAVRALAAKAHAAGVTIVDAPVSGSVTLAEAGTITAMVGADPEVFAAVQPVLAEMTRAQFHTGPVGSASAAKLAVNLVVASVNQAVAEALTVAAAHGLNSAVFYDVLESSVVAAPYIAYKREAFLSPETAGVSLLQKDVRLGLELAHQHDVHLPVAATVGRLLREAGEAGLADRDMAEVLRLLQHQRPGGSICVSPSL